MKRIWVWLFMSLIIFTAAVGPQQAKAQLSFSNRLEYQIGNLPEVQPGNRTTLFDQLNLSWSGRAFTAGARIETFNVGDGSAEYSRFSRKYLKYSGENMTLQVGNFYEILGRGLLLRSYEIPGVTYEDPASRERYGFYKDVEGLSLKYETKFMNAKLLYGKPLDLLQPPSRSGKLRRPALVQGGEVNLRFIQQAVPGVLYLRSERDGRMQEFGGGTVGGYFNSGFSWYAEYVQQMGRNNDALRLGTQSRHAFYTSASQTLDWISLSAEYKDYHDFTLNFNDPPNAVREHSFSLINRSTHAIQPQDERGYQLESIINFSDLNTITLNHARATSDLGGARFTFWEYYAGVDVYAGDSFLGKGFIDLAQDEIINEKERWSTGLSLENTFAGRWTLYGDFQAQRFERKYPYSQALNHEARNFYTGLTLSRSPLFSLGVTLETSNDALVNGTFPNPDEGKYKTWTGFNFNYRYSQQHTLYLFYGQRRGGNACSGGICYEVQPFEGIEIRLDSVF